MSDLRIKNSGSTANGLVSGSIPNGNLRVPEWKNVDVVGNLINMYYQNEKNNRENEALQLSKAKQDLTEQMFAYGAFNDEIGRQMSLKLQEMQNQNNLDKVKLENSSKSKEYPPFKDYIGEVIQKSIGNGNNKKRVISFGDKLNK